MSVSISPLSISGLAGIPAVAFQLLTSGTPSVDVASTINDASSTVRISSTGQLLSALSSFETQLTDRQDNSADVSSKAASLVEAFNFLQSNVSNLQNVFDALSDTSVVDQSLQTSTGLVSSLIAPESPVLSRLQGIGINIETALSPGASGASVTLSIDQNALAAAIESDITGTSAVLTQVSQSLLDQSAGIKAQIVETSASLAALSQSGLSSAQQRNLGTLLGLTNSPTLPLTSVGTDLLQNLTADVVLNDLELSDLDLAEVGLDASTIMSNDTVRRGSLVENLLSFGSNTSVEELLAAVGNLLPNDDGLLNATLYTLPAEDNLVTPASVAAAVETPTTIDLPVPTTSTIAATDESFASAAVVANTEAVQTDRSLSIATLVLQDMLNNPSVRAINNNRFDPAYSAIVAATHLSDFVKPFPVTARSTQYPDVLAPVSPARGIAYYNESVGGNWR